MRVCVSNLRSQGFEHVTREYQHGEDVSRLLDHRATEA